MEPTHNRRTLQLIDKIGLGPDSVKRGQLDTHTMRLKDKGLNRYLITLQTLDNGLRGHWDKITLGDGFISTKG